MDTVPYHPKLWKAYHDSTTSSTISMSSLDSSSSSGSSSNYYMMNNNCSYMEYIYLYIAFFVGVFITIVCITLMNICMRLVVNEVTSKSL